MKKGTINWQRILPILLSALSAGLSLLTTFFIARPLGAEEFGKVQFYVGVIQVLSIATALGLPDFLTKNAQFAQNKKAFFSKYFLLVCCWSIIVYPIFFAVSYFFLHSFEKNIILIVVTGLASFAQCVCMLIGGFFLGIFKQTKAILFENLLPKLVFFLFALALIVVFSIREGFSTYYVYGFLAIYGATSLIFIFSLVRRSSFKFTKKEVISILSFFALSATYGFNTALGKIIGSEYYNSFAGVGAYSLSAQIAILATLFTEVINSMSKPVFSSLANNKEKLINYFQKITRVNSYIVIPFCMGIIVQSKTLLSLFGESYAPFFMILVIMGLGTLLTSITGPNGSMLAMAGHEKLEVMNGIINILIFLIASFSFIFLGSVGLALATFVSLVTVKIIKLIEMWAVYKTNPFPWKLVEHILVLIVASSVAFSIVDRIPNIYVKVGVDCVVGIALIVLNFVVNPYKDDKYFFSNRDKIDSHQQ